MLTESEAQQIATKFLTAQYFGSKVAFISSQVITKNALQIYQMEGKITIPSRGDFTRFISQKSANSHAFKIEVGIQGRNILHYEFE